MLRSLVLILVIVNVCFLAWSQGWLRQWVGVHPDTQREPQRLSQQLQPERIEVLRPGGRPASATRSEAETARSSPSEPAPIDAPASGAGVGPEAEAEGMPPAPPSLAAAASQAAGSTEPTLCVEAGPFRPEDAAAAEQSVKAVLPSGSWGRQSIPVSGQWMIYMGPYPDEELYARKLAELRRFKGVAFDEVKRPANLAQGLSLGRFTSEKEAEERLSVLKQRGIRSAKLITLRPAGVVQYVRVTQATVRMQVALSGVKLPQGKAFTACRS